MAAALLATSVATAAAGQIVYDHGSDIWVMNDDGSNQHALLTLGQVPGMSSIGDPNVFPNGGTSLAFSATTLQYLQTGNGPAGACGINCEALYTLVNGVVTRLTAAPAPCGVTQQWCASFSTDPVWMANGNLAYEDSVYAWYYDCSTFPCYWAFYPGWIDQISVVPPTAGAGVGTKWTTQHSWGGSAVIMPDPVDATKLFYVGGPTCVSSSCNYFIYASTGSGTDTAIIQDDNLIQAALSPDGSKFADVEGGNLRGIWTYGSNASNPTQALVDPIQTGPSDPGNNPFDVTFHNVAWVGTSRIVFEANNNLWSIPASCNKCAWPSAATQLTTDGTSSAPDNAPTWTSTTTPLTPPPTSSPGPGSGVQGSNTQSTGPTAGTSSLSAASVNGNNATLSLSCGGAASASCVLNAQLVVVETLQGSRIVAVKASKKPKHKNRTVVVGAATVTLTGGQTKILSVALNGTGKSLLKQHHTLKVGLLVTQTVGAATQTVKSSTLTFKYVKPKR
jgi:hypothetical protein